METRGKDKDYSNFRHAIEKFFNFVYANGWPATVAYRLGFQHKVIVSNYKIELRSNPVSSPPLKIVFASDFHACQTTHFNLLKNACGKISAVKPDLVLLGGDFVTLDTSYIEDLALELEKIHAPFGKYAVLGNHDVWTNETIIIRHLESSGIKMLVNSNVQLNKPYDHIWICGLDDDRTGNPDPDTALRGANGVRIVFMHSPDGLISLKNHQFNVAFCGHTHGGQIALPNGRPIVSAYGHLTRTYNHGLYHVGNDNEGTLIVSRGIGYTILPIRIFADPEIVNCVLSWHEINPGIMG